MLFLPLLDVLLNIVRAIFGTVEIDVSLLSSFLDKIFDIIRVACYLLPMGTVAFIFTITHILMIYRLAVSVLSTLWRILPLV